MSYVHYAVVNEMCPVCGKGRVLVAAEKDGRPLFVICEDCESEWSDPKQANDGSIATRDHHTFSRYMEPCALVGHE